MSEHQYIEYTPRIIYQYVGMLHHDGEYRIVTRQCASIVAAAREAIKYADNHGVSRASMRVCKLEELDVQVETVNPYQDERATK